MALHNMGVRYCTLSCYAAACSSYFVVFEEPFFESALLLILLALGVQPVVVRSHDTLGGLNLVTSATSWPSTLLEVELQPSHFVRFI